MDEKNKERQPTFSFLEEKDGSRATTTLIRVRRIVGSLLLEAHHYHEKNPMGFSILLLSILPLDVPRLPNCFTVTELIQLLVYVNELLLRGRMSLEVFCRRRLPLRL